MSPTLLIAVLLPVVATLVGGIAVLKSHQNLRPWLSLSGGVLLGLAFLDLIPEAFEAGASAGLSGARIGGFALASILFFHLLDKAFDFHGHEGHDHEADCHNAKHKTISVWARVSGMGFHSFLDGLAIGGGFAADARLGFLVTLAVMLHKFTDGATTVTLVHAHGGERSKIQARIALGAIVLLPLLGLALGRYLVPSEAATAVFLAILAGLFIHLPLSELLPQAHEGKTSRLGLVLTIVGIFFMAFVKKMVG